MEPKSVAGAVTAIVGVALVTATERADELCDE